MTTAPNAHAAHHAPASPADGNADRITQILILVSIYLPALIASALVPDRSAWTNALALTLAISTTSGILLTLEISRKPHRLQPALAVIGYALTALAIPVILAYVIAAQIHPGL